MDGNLAYKLDGHFDEPWEERIRGKIIMMAPALVNHNRVAFNIAGVFRDYLKGRRCEYFPDGTGLFLSEEEHYVPDGMVVCDPDKVSDRGVTGAPDLVVEVLSRCTARNDRGHKKNIYERYGVREYWIVDPVVLSVEQYVLEEGQFVLRDVYHKYSSSEREAMNEEERSAIVTEFPCAIFDDLMISIEEVFGRVTVR